ncbi:MAG: MBL fold metallo-hydrolase, partial [Actinomycetota bacterium]|nr:MBL fold metallo-hydrolase [Actinomycetota bacterium]
MSEIEQVTLSMGGFEVNSYVVHAPDGDIVVDAGAEPEKILGATRAPVAAILVTHGHADHVEALEFVRSETGAPVYMHPADAGGKV